MAYKKTGVPMDKEIAELISTTMSAIESASEWNVDPPALLYHFTDAQGLIGIVDTGGIWATNASCTNDATEVTHALSVARKVLEKKSQAAPMTSAIVPSALRLLTEPIASSPTELKFVSFIASFCGRVDKSAHWLHYGRQGLGYAIGFEPVGIQPTDWLSVPVLYDDSSQETMLSSIYNKIEAKSSEIISRPSHQPRHIIEEVTSELLVMTARIVAPCFKNHAFNEEEEWRVFKLHIESPRISNKHMVTPEFRVANGRIIPYINLELPTGDQSPIREIVAGYQIDEAVTSESLRFLFRKAGRPYPIVRKSDVPVRPV
jgi:hypothetical protein